MNYHVKMYKTKKKGRVNTRPFLTKPIKLIKPKPMKLKPQQRYPVLFSPPNKQIKKTCFKTFFNI